MKPNTEINLFISAHVRNTLYRMYKITKQGHITPVGNQHFLTFHTKYFSDMQSNTVKINLFQEKDEPAD